MRLTRKLSLTAIAIIFGLSSCTDDKKKAVEPVSSSSTAETPSSPTAANATDVKTSTIYFGFDDYTLTQEAQATLSAMAEGLKANKSVVIQIEGHCDERGTVEYNLALGERRAQSVKNFLTQLGVESARLSTISYGEEKPVVQGHAEDSWQKNRRAEFIVTKS